MIPWYVFGLLTALFSAAAAIVMKKTLFKEHAMEFAATLAIINAIITAPFLIGLDPGAITPTALAATIGVGVIAGTAYLLVAKAVRHLPISVSSPLLALGPLVSTFFAFVVLDEQLTMINFFGVVLVVIGVYVLEHHNGVSITKNLSLFFKQRYVRFIAAALILYALSGVLVRYILAPSGLGVDPMSYLALAHIIIALFFFALITILYDGAAGIMHGLRKAWVPITIIAALTVSHRLFQAIAFSFEEGKLGLVEALKRSGVVIATVVGGELFSEDHLPRRAFSTLIIIGGVLLVII